MEITVKNKCTAKIFTLKACNTEPCCHTECQPTVNTTQYNALKKKKLIWASMTVFLLTQRGGGGASVGLSHLVSFVHHVKVNG